MSQAIMLRSSKQIGPSNESTGISLRDQQSSNNGTKTNGTGGHSNRKFWGEEVTDDAIYNVYLKKINYSCQDAVYDQLPSNDGSNNSRADSLSNGNDRSHDLSTNSGTTNGNESGGGSGSLVDGLQRAFFSKDVFRRKSLDKGSSSSKSKRSASTSDMLDYGRINGSLVNGGIRSQNHPQQQQQQPYPNSTSSSSLNTSNDGIKMKNYQKILTETFPSRTISPTKLAHQKMICELNNSDSSDPTQSLQWETRQIRILKAATLDHIVQYILHLTRRQQEQELKESTGNTSHCQSVVMEEERNNVSHVMHVLFIAYRSFSNPAEIFQLINQYSSQTCTSHQQFNFIMIYWLNHYPEDFLVSLNPNNNSPSSKSHRSKSSSNILNSIEPQSLPPSGVDNRSSPVRSDREPKSLPSPTTKRHEFSSRRASSGISRDRSCSSSRRSNHRESRLVDLVLSQPNLDQMITRKAMIISENTKSNPFNDIDVFDSASANYAMNGVSYETICFPFIPCLNCVPIEGHVIESFLS